VTGAPADARRRGLAAAGVNPLRRPPAARGRSRLFVIATLAVLAACCTALAGYLASRSPAPAGNVFTTRQQVSLQQVRSAISSLYGSHPDIASFTVQDVSYTASSRDTVLRECTSGGPAVGSQNAETHQVIACAPLIFFFYSYGTQASVPAAVTVAGELYWYAVTHITGPTSARTSLDEVLSSWKLPVPGLTPTRAKSALVASVITAANDSISAEVVLTDASRVLPVSETLTADGETKVVTLSRWGSPVTVPVPGSAVAYPALQG